MIRLPRDERALLYEGDDGWYFVMARENLRTTAVMSLTAPAYSRLSPLNVSAETATMAALVLRGDVPRDSRHQHPDARLAEFRKTATIHAGAVPCKPPATPAAYARADPKAGAISREQAAVQLGVAYSTLEKLAARGEGPFCFCVGDLFRYPVDELEAWKRANDARQYTPSGTTGRPASQASNQGSGDGYLPQHTRVDGLRGSAPGRQRPRKVGRSRPEPHTPPDLGPMAVGRPTTIRPEAKVAGKPSQAKPCRIDVFPLEMDVPVPKDAE